MFSWHNTTHATTSTKSSTQRTLVLPSQQLYKSLISRLIHTRNAAGPSISTSSWPAKSRNAATHCAPTDEHTAIIVQQHHPPTLEDYAMHYSLTGLLPPSSARFTPTQLLHVEHASKSLSSNMLEFIVAEDTPKLWNSEGMVPRTLQGWEQHSVAYGSTLRSFRSSSSESIHQHHTIAIPSRHGGGVDILFKDSEDVQNA